MKRRGDSCAHSERLGEPEVLALPVGCPGKWGERRCPSDPASCWSLNPALVRVLWGAGSGGGFGGSFLMLSGPREDVHFAFLNIHLLAVSVMLEVNKCADRLGNSSAWCEEVEIHSPLK